MAWYGTNGERVDWNSTYHSLLCVFGTTGLDEPAARDVMFLLHSGGKPQAFQVPKQLLTRKWRLLLDTSRPTPSDIYPEANGPMLPVSGRLTLDHHTMVCYVSV